MKNVVLGITWALGLVFAAGCGDQGAGGGDLLGASNDRAGESTANRRPQAVLGNPSGPMIAAGVGHVLALHADGTVFSWGTNGFGELGDGTTTLRSRATVVAIDHVIAVEAGAGVSYAIDADHVLWAWGSNGNGLLASSAIHSDQHTPVETGLADVVQVAAGLEHALALRSDGTVVSWGRNTYGQLGVGHTSAGNQPPTVVSSLSNVVAIAAGYYDSYAVTSDGTLWSWGYSIALGRLPSHQDVPGV